MADINQETERLAETMAKLNQQMDELGMVTQDTQRKLFDAQVKAKHGWNNATEALENAGKAAGHLAKAGAEAAKAMYNNEKGSKAFGSTMDNLSSAATAAGVALMLLGGPITMLVGGLAMLTGGLVKLAKVAGEQSDALYKGFQDLSKSGGAASDGMTGLFGDIQKLGLGFQDLEGYTRLIAESSKELALFGGNVIQGRKQFANIGQAMEPFRESLMNAGMTQEEINEASMGYLRLQSRIGQTQNKTVNELADGARKYLIEQDALTKLTGMTRKEQEDAREEIRSQERFAATLAEMRAKGQNKEAKELEDTYLVLRSQSKEAAQGFADVSTGMLTTEAAQKSYLATQGESMRVSQQIQAGQLNAAQAAQRVAKAHGETADAMAPLAKMGVYGQTFGDYAADLRLKGMAEADIEKQLAKVRQEQIDQGVTGNKAADSQQQTQTDLRLSQQRTMLSMQRMVNYAVEPATNAIEAFGKAVEYATLKLNKMLDWLGLGPERQITAAETKANDELKKQQDEIYRLELKRLDAKTAADRKLVDEEIKAARQRAKSAAAVARQAKKQAESDYEAGRAGQATTGAAQEAALAGGAGTTSPVITTQKGLADAGLKLRPSGGDIQKDDAPVSPKLIALAKKIQDAIPNFNYFSGFNDKFHHTLDYSSRHTQGLALDFALAKKPTPEEGQEIIDTIKAMGASKVLDEYNKPTAASTGGHIHVEIPKFADGGIAQGPKSGYPVELHGTEAVIPLKNGAVPVSLDMRNAMTPQGIGPTFAGMNEYTGYNMGPMSTDLSAVKDIAAKLGAYDAATKMITDPNMWKQILGSGIAMNYDLGMTEIGTKMIPGIGAEIGERIQELKSTGTVDTASAIEQVTKEFKTAMLDAVKQMSAIKGDPAAGEQLALLSALVQEQKASNSIQEKLLRAAAN